MGDFVEKQKTINVELSEKIDTMESSLNRNLDGVQSDLDQKIDILQYSISRLTNQHVHQEEENPEEECLIDTILGEQAQLQQLQEQSIEEPAEAAKELPVGEAREEFQKLILQPFPIKSNPSATPSHQQPTASSTLS